MPRKRAASKSAKSRVVRDTKAFRRIRHPQFPGRPHRCAESGWNHFVYQRSLEPLREGEWQSSTESGRTGNKLFGDLEASGV